MAKKSGFWESGKEVSEAAEKAGGVITLWAGPRVIFAINDPDDAFTVLNSCLEKSYFYRLGSSWVGYGLLTSNVPTWKRHRKLMNPTFSQHVLDGFLEVFNRQAALLVQDMEPKAGKGEFIPMEYITERTLEAVCQTVIGISLDDRSVINKEYKRAIEDALYVVAERLASFWLHPEICYRFSGLRKIMDKAMLRVHNMSRTMLNKRRSERLQARHASTTSSRFIAFLDLLLDLTEDGSFSDEQIQEELDTLIAAGYDTSSRALLSTLVFLGTYQEVQEKMYQEIMSVLGSSVDLVKEDMPRLVYTEAVIKEVLRLSPVAPFIAREVEKEVKLKNYTIPAGSECAVTFWGIHRLPIWGPDRLEFRPERWLDPSTLPQSPSAFCGFSLGRRNCIGKTYALMAMKTSLVHLIRKYRITADYSKVKLKYAVLLEYAAGHEISLQLRK
ncbi:cytochrome P450 4C1-like [Cydia fagiglandana]|uniref:cytochrome P450 4C1-like n=1 Tax=Cydia fagiglandana TaxID=1458189 RepID=UPI002FEE3D82